MRLCPVPCISSSSSEKFPGLTSYFRSSRLTGSLEGLSSSCQCLQQNMPISYYRYLPIKPSGSTTRRKTTSSSICCVSYDLILSHNAQQSSLTIALAVLRSLCSNPNGLCWAGDTAQTIALGSSFKFSELTSTMYRVEVWVISPHKALVIAQYRPTGKQLEHSPEGLVCPTSHVLSDS